MTNVADAETAHRIAEALIERRLAACVSVLAPCTAYYRWGGKQERADEVPVLIKTTSTSYAALERELRELHPYELPEILAVPVEQGLPAYLEWVEKECAGSDPQARSTKE